MEFNIYSSTPLDLKHGQLVFLTNQGLFGLTKKNLLSDQSLAELVVGEEIIDPERQEPVFQIVGSFWSPQGDLYSRRSLWLEVKSDYYLQGQKRPFIYRKEGWSLAWIVLSDKGYQGLRQDLSGPEVPLLMERNFSLCLKKGFLIPDNKIELKNLLINLALEQRFDLIITTGGTGVTSRDITPEVTMSILDKRLFGFEQAILLAALDKTPQAMISRAVCGILNRSLIVNLPGSPKAVRENLQTIIPAINHTLEKVHDVSTDCAKA